MRLGTPLCPKCGNAAGCIVEYRVIHSGIEQDAAEADASVFEWSGDTEDIYECDEPQALVEVLGQLEHAMTLAQDVLGGLSPLPLFTVQVALADALDALDGARNNVTLRCDECMWEWSSTARDH